MSKYLKWFSAGAGVVSIMGSVGLFFSNLILHLKNKEEDVILSRETGEKLFNYVTFDRLPKEEVWIESPFDYSLHALLVKPYQSNRYMIFSHGVTESKTNMIKYMNLFMKKGFNALLYDQRRHGKSGGENTSYGFYERHDLKAVADWLKKRVGDDLTLGIFGESMGGATTLMYAGTVEDEADFYVVDCPYSDFTEQLKIRLKEDFRLPPFILSYTDLFLKWRAGYSMKEVAPIQAIQHIKKPVLFIHGQEDHFIPASMTKLLYDAKQGDKELYMPEKGGHAATYAANPLEYEEAVYRFLERVAPWTKNFSPASD